MNKKDFTTTETWDDLVQLSKLELIIDLNLFEFTLGFYKGKYMKLCLKYWC